METLMSKEELERRNAQEMAGYIKGFEGTLDKIKAEIRRERLMFLKEGKLELAEGLEKAELIISRYERSQNKWKL